MDNKIIGVVLALVVGIIVIGTLLVPTINNYEEEHKTIQNTGAYFTSVGAEEEHTIVFKTDKIVYDGVDVAYPEGYGTGNERNATLMVGSDWFLRADAGLTRLLLAGPPQQYLNMGSLADGDIIATISDGDVSFSYGTNQTATRDAVTMTIAPEGDYVLCNNPYILDDTPILGGVRTSGVYYDIFQVVSGTIDNLSSETARVLKWSDMSTTTIETAEFTPDLKDVSGNLKQINKITEDLTFADGGSAEVILSYLIAPAEITYDNPEYIGSGSAALIGAIAVISIVGLLVIAVRVTIRD